MACEETQRQQYQRVQNFNRDVRRRLESFQYSEANSTEDRAAINGLWNQVIAGMGNLRSDMDEHEFERQQIMITCLIIGANAINDGKLFSRGDQASTVHPGSPDCPMSTSLTHYPQRQTIPQLETAQQPEMPPNPRRDPSADIMRRLAALRLTPSSEPVSRSYDNPLPSLAPWKCPLNWKMCLESGESCEEHIHYAPLL